MSSAAQRGPGAGRLRLGLLGAGAIALVLAVVALSRGLDPAPAAVTPVASEREPDGDGTTLEGEARAVAAGRDAALPLANMRETPLPTWPGDVPEELPEPPGEGPIVVTVVERNGRPVVGAYVRLKPDASPPVEFVWDERNQVPRPIDLPGDGGPLVLTDAHGRCRVQAAAGQALVATFGPGLAGLGFVNDAILQRGCLDIVVREGQILRARIVGTKGQPASGATVVASALGPGRGFVGKADAAGRVAWILDGQTAYLISAADGPARSETVLVPAAVGGHIDIVVRMLGAVQIEGRVLDPHGVTIAGASVRANPIGMLGRRPEDGASRLVVESDDAGQFRLALPQTGNYRLEATHPDWAPGPWEDVRVEFDRPTTVALRLGMWATFEGIVRWRDGPPVAGAQLRFFGRQERGRFARPDQCECDVKATTDAQGAYRVERVPGHLIFEVWCTPDPRRPLARVERNEIVPSQQHFVLDPALLGAGVDLVVHVADGPSPRAVRAEVRQRNHRSVLLPNFGEEIALSGGRGRIDALQPRSTYVVDVAAPGYGRVTSEPFVAGEVQTVEVTLPRGARLEVRVVDDHGDPAVDADVELFETERRRFLPGQRADARGRVTFADMGPGDYTVTARRERARGSERVVLDPGKRHRVEVRLR